MKVETIWLCVGLLGQFFFTMRFLMQWIWSEIHKKSIIPVVFWYASILGGATLLAYSIYRRDPVFILGQSAGIIVYSRNLYFIHREKKKS